MPSSFPSFMHSHSDKTVGCFCQLIIQQKNGSMIKTLSSSCPWTFHKLHTNARTQNDEYLSWASLKNKTYALLLLFFSLRVLSKCIFVSFSLPFEYCNVNMNQSYYFYYLKQIYRMLIVVGIIDVVRISRLKIDSAVDDMNRKGEIVRKWMWFLLLFTP